MNDLILIGVVLVLGFVLYSKIIKPRLESKIKEMETELQKRKQQK